MIRRPGQLVNDGLVFQSVELPEVDGFDLQLSIDNVVTLGGDERLYRHFLAEALAVSGADVLAVAALAAWRSGAIELRADALRRVDAAAPAAVAAALGIAPGDLSAFVHEQKTNRFGWPGAQTAAGVVAWVGGFRGLGGEFTSPPLSADPLEREGGFALHTATDDWEYDGDVFGGRLIRVDGPGATGPTRGAELKVSALSYLAALVLA
jgi:hypothetical protein